MSPVSPALQADSQRIPTEPSPQIKQAVFKSHDILNFEAALKGF